MELLVSGRTFKCWSLIEGGWVTVVVPLKETLGLLPFPVPLFLAGCLEMSKLFWLTSHHATGSQAMDQVTMDGTL